MGFLFMADYSVLQVRIVGVAAHHTGVVGRDSDSGLSFLTKDKRSLVMFKKTQIAFLVCSIFVLSACNEQRTLTPQEQELVGQLKQERDKLGQDIDTVSAEIAQYNGGLIKAIKQVREETLKLSRDILTQRIQAIETGAKVTIVVPTSQPDPERAQALQSDIEIAKQHLVEAKAKAAQYSGGLIAAVSQSTVATQEQTLAMLEQQYLVSKYGLPLTVSSSALSTPKTGSNVKATVPNETKETPTPIEEPHVMLAADGPFGVAMGMTKEMFKGHITPIGNGTYLFDNPPKPHPDFVRYAVQISDKSGLCWIKAIGKDITTNPHGHQLQTEFDDFEEKLDQRYGKHKRTDFLTVGSIWKEPEDWMRALHKKERYLFTSWKGAEKPLPNDIASVALLATANDTNSGYLAIEYSFSNETECEQEIKAQNDAGL